MIKIQYKLRFPSSVYAATESGGNLYVGGSNWNRRTVRYSKNIARKAKGVLYILKKKGTGKTFTTNRKVLFPSMIYTILVLPNGTLFVGCKGEKDTMTIIDKQGNLLISRDDKDGKGVYNAILNRKKSEIILTTRSGKLEIIDSRTLRLKSKIQLSSQKVRLWSLKFDAKNEVIYAGDYDGILYIVERKKFFRKKVRLLDIKKFYTGDKRLREGFGPSLWGLEIMGNNIVIGTRWGDLIIFDKNFKLIKSFNIGEDISCIERLSKEILLVGTRFGKLFSFDLDSHQLKKIIEIKPALQKENAIWGMISSASGVLVCFADGYVCKIS